MRHILRQKHEEDDVRVALRSKLNLVTTENVHEDIAAINLLINDLQGATASYFILENEYHRQEEELAQLEYDYNERLEISQTTFEYQSGSVAHVQPINSDTKSSSADYASEYEEQMLPQVADYLMVGEARVLAERLSGLKTEYLLHERVDIPFDSAALNSLLLYQDEKTKIETELTLPRHDVESHPEHANCSPQIAEEEDN
ncbi:hypothetical protein N7530_001010 [Penicillium desertorum]|uniref:Uncharacterized protein n=1 Tax=Penicillium desertorum TaxID=1303715 RepID=A0A9W9X9D1_9EURO|nr:hypothetical protein N7530_001010 [Penicillium desertorum]